MNRTRRLAPTPLLVPTLLALAGTPARAQDAASTQLVDRVVAVVGDSMILQSELDEEIINNFAAMGRALPQDSATLEQLRREALDQLISELLFVQAAARDSVTVPEDEIRSAVDAEIAQRQRAMGGEAALTRALSQARLTLAQYREILTRDARRQRTMQYYLGTLQQRRRPPPVTEEEVRDFFEAQKGMLGKRPASLTFEQVVIAPRPSDSARTRARERALEILRELRAGADFATLARRHSDDPGTREQGGELGWFRRGDMVPQFDSAAFALRPGELSGVVESAFGFHIIRLDRIRGAERQARHILIRPELTDADLGRAPELAREVAERARAGESMAALAEQFGAPDEQRRVEVSRDRLPSPYDTELAQAEAGSVVGPFRLPANGGPDRWAVVKVLEVVPEGEYSLDDPRVHAMVREQLEYQKLLDEVLEELRRRMHVDVRL